MRPTVPIFLILALTLIPSIVVAQADGGGGGDAETGKRVAQQWCSSCHVTNGGHGGTDMAPPFHAIANNPVNTLDGLRAFLMDPHGRMPKIHISRADIDDIIAYLSSLKKK